MHQKLNWIIDACARSHLNMTKRGPRVAPRSTFRPLLEERGLGEDGDVVFADDSGIVGAPTVSTSRILDRVRESIGRPLTLYLNPITWICKISFALIIKSNYTLDLQYKSLYI